MDKAGWRERIQQWRRALPGDVHAAEARALAARVAAADLGDTVCAYLPTRTEPGDTAMLDTLRAGGARVLLPVIDGPVLRWAPYTGPDGLRAARFGLSEPVTDPLEPGAHHGASAMLVPALAVDRRGVRLGKGGGYYDRTLPGMACPLVAVVRAEEVVDELPVEAHDVLVTHALTPESGPWPLPGPRREV